jgi:hypothetical protein
MKQSFSPHPYLCSELVSIATRNTGRDSQAIAGNLEAIGERSVLVLTQVPLRRGTEIRIDANPHVLKGIVKQCSFEAPLGCYVEVSLEPESRWSERWFRPKHLVALEVAKPEENSSKGLYLENLSVTEDFLRADFAPVA